MIFIESNKTKNSNFTGKLVLSFLLVVFFSTNLFCQQRTDVVTFKVKTSSSGGNYSPKNIGAIWVEDNSGNFVKTLKLWANKRKQYLYTWKSTSGENTVDAVTSATLTSHQSHEVTWDVKDKNGNRVSDGTYKLKIEITDKHSQGPVASFNFPIGDSTNVIQPADLTNFHNIELSWNSHPTSLNDGVGFEYNYQLYQNYPNPFNPTTTIVFAIPVRDRVQIEVYNSIGEKVAGLVNKELERGEYKISFDASNIPSGVLFFKMKTSSFEEIKKSILLK
ncbi:MAG: DUF2271 domain-containing protein [Melioribacteraceae bacterium]|nr:DUF2271 domain-containing protein [Melioribacteraceae bacterium]MCF8264811.1 DUF2271 domain-containing protein [Melioribacteraceae bacterium]MCF8414410.1 DUF2271 domain-containing protein [Melioribacteraceae bacterium]MCF8430354.1 DUF2271 domain-containing protein [Melioribacteraceae bacterium]